MSDNESSLTPFDGDLPFFEQRGRPNGFTTWSARDVAHWLGYSDYTAFGGVLKRAQEALLTLEIDISEHFSKETFVDESGHQFKDLRMSRFACYLAAMNGDTKKKQVAKAQVYFARFSEECQRYLDDLEQLDRVVIRKDITKHERSLNATAKGAGVEDYALFRNAGYRGLYNMNLSDLKKLKGIPKERTPLDFMGKTELAANLFWSTQTEERIKQKGIRGQTKLEATAEHVGKTIRNTMKDLSGKRPEDLAPQEDIRIVRRDLKNSGDVLKHGKPSDLKELPAPEPEGYTQPPDEQD